MNDSVVKIYRGSTVESTHSGHLAVIDSEGKILYKHGNPDLVTFLRSSAKPFQTIPLVETGAAHRFKFSVEEIAIISGSHSGEEKHVEVVSNILEKIGLKPEHLQCGTHLPHYYVANDVKQEML